MEGLEGTGRVWCKRSGTAPLDRVLQTVIAPEQLLAHSKMRRSEHSEIDRTAGLRRQAIFDILFLRATDDALGVHSNLSQCSLKISARAYGATFHEVHLEYLS